MVILLNDVSKDIIFKFKADKVYDLYTTWAKEYDKEMYELVTRNEAMSK